MHVALSCDGAFSGSDGGRCVAFIWAAIVALGIVVVCLVVASAQGQMRVPVRAREKRLPVKNNFLRI